jgi:hypothetical protein
MLNEREMNTAYNALLTRTSGDKLCLLIAFLQGILKRSIGAFPDNAKPLEEE